MKKHLHFKEYLLSKKRLREAEDKTPVIDKKYSSKKYCKFPLMRNKDDDDKEYFALKPYDNVIITWKVYDIESPTPLYVSFESSENSKKYYFVWSDKKIRSWVKSTLSEIPN